MQLTTSKTKDSNTINSELTLQTDENKARGKDEIPSDNLLESGSQTITQLAKLFNKY